MDEQTSERVIREPTLYRKYRPERFFDVLGQEHVVTVLTNALAEERVAHAYLSAGPRGTGKTTVARILARRLNCERPNGAEPCGTCARCVAARTRSDLDVVEIDAASNRGIDEIRALKERIALAPAAGAYKVYIVDEVHMLTKEAFNALLKTLEEPPSHAVFILATTDLQKVPDTIRSRCQTFQFRRAPVALIVRRLQDIAAREKVAIESEALHLIAYQSEGCFRDAESLLGQVLGAGNRRADRSTVERTLGIAGLEAVRSFLDQILARDARAALDALRQVTEQGVSLNRFAEECTRYARALVSQAIAGVQRESFPPHVEAAVRETASRYPAAELLALVRLLLRAKTEMRDAVFEELPLELVVLEWCGDRVVPEVPRVVVTAAERSGRGRGPRQGSGGNSPASVTGAEPPSSAARGADQPELLTRVLAAWPTFLKRSAALNPLLLSTLESCRPSTARENVVYLVTTFSLYKDRVSDTAVRTPLEELLESLVGERVFLRVALQSEAARLGLPDSTVPVRVGAARASESVPQETHSAETDVVSLFGGTVLERS